MAHRLSSVVFVGVAATFGFAGLAAGALTVPDAKFVVGGQVSSVPLTKAFDHNGTDYQLVVTGAAYGGQDPQSDIQGHVNWYEPAPQGFTSIFSASVTYYYVLSGPAGAITAPIILHVKGHASATGSASASASIVQGSFFGNNYYSATTYSALADSNTPFAEFDETVRYDEIVDQVHGITVQSIGFLRDSDGSYQALADPIIEIDPTAPDAELYSITWSTNIPAPGAVMVLCVGGVLASSRRRSR